jgi:site-specific DNA-methyltransferase (adenine-specific)
VTPYYSEAGIEIWLGDCREIWPTLGEIDLVCTDPPFEAEAHTPMRRTNRSIQTKENVAMPFAPITEELRGWLTNIQCNWLLAFCQAEAVSIYQVSLGLKYRRPMVWVKPDSAPQFTGDRPAMGYESIVCAWMAEGKSRWNGGGRRGVFTYSVNGYERWHPTQKPLPLMTELISLFSLGGVICDPFLGSGTTLLAAKQLRRKAVGIEIEERYCEIAAKRLMNCPEPLAYAPIAQEKVEPVSLFAAE